VTTENTEPVEQPATAASPLALALSRVPEDVRAAVEAGRRDDRWELAEEALRRAVRRDEVGDTHADYARILLAIGSFELCRDALGKTGTAEERSEDCSNIEAELLVEQTAAQQWTAVPDRDGQAIPTTTAAVVAMSDALRQARALEPSDAQTLHRLDLFDEVVTWASRTPFSGNVGAPLAASLFGLLGLIQWLRDRTLLGFQGEDILPLPALYLACAALYCWLARTPQVALNRQVVAGARSLDQRFLQALLKAGPLVAVPVAAVRSVVYGSVIPLFVVHHCIRRRQPMVSGLVLAACVATVHWYTSDEPEQAPDPEPLVAGEEQVPGLDLLGHWIPLTGSIRVAVQGLPGIESGGPGRWRARTNAEAGGYSLVVESDEQEQLEHVALSAWALGTDSPSPWGLVRRSAEATEDYWGPAVSTEERASGAASCSTHVLLYGQPDEGLRVRRQNCEGASPRVTWEAWPR